VDLYKPVDVGQALSVLDTVNIENESAYTVAFDRAKIMSVILVKDEKDSFSFVIQRNGSDRLMP
jgi:hypothetical protein